MTRQILLPASVLREMRETFKVGRNVLRRALNYERNSDRAKALREFDSLFKKSVIKFI